MLATRPVLSAPRLVPSVSGADADARIARLGGRVFELRGSGDRVVTLPGADGAVGVAVPRGFGHPLLARRVPGGLRAEPTGEPCAPARWCWVGAVAARLRRVRLPRGPMPALRPLDNARQGCSAAPALWLCVRASSVAWGAARDQDTSLGRGAVAVVDRWVRGVSPSARARGVRRGMSVSLARRRCPDLRVVGPASGGAPDVRSVLAREFARVERAGAGWLVALDAPFERALDAAEHLALRIWQAVGVEVRIGVAAAQDDASALCRMLDPGCVGFVPASAAGVWRSAVPRAAYSRGLARSSWAGAPIPDIDAAADLCRTLLPSGACAEGDARLSVRVVGLRGAFRVSRALPRGAARAALEGMLDAALRPRLLAVGDVVSVSLRVEAAAPPRAAPAPQARQLALIAGAR